MSDLTLTYVFCSRGLTESDFLRRLSRRYSYVLIEILSPMPAILSRQPLRLKTPIPQGLYVYASLIVYTQHDTTGLSILRLSPL
jgi:hypothetical protein